MLEVLRKKMTRLVRGEEGVALVVTLALFMMLYISTAGVFAIGKSVKERIILQNAVDAAAYSAAVVEADYLSRIATINRAMAWTYRELVICQQNLIAWQFFSEMLDDKHYSLDKLKARNNDKISGISGGSDLTIQLKGTDLTCDLETNEKIRKEAELKQISVDEIEEIMDDLPTEAELKGDVSKFSGLLDTMYSEIYSLMSKLSSVDQYAKEVASANLPGRLGELCCCKVKCPKPNILQDISCDDGGESRFLAFANEDRSEFRKWLPLDLGSEEDPGIRRVYDNSLEAEWWYWPKENSTPTYFKGIGYAKRDAQNVSRARPQILKESYFPVDNSGNEQISQGAITVAVAKWNENPWYSIFLGGRELANERHDESNEDGTVIGRFYSVFNHAKQNRWTLAVASAQAGYRKRRDSSENPSGRQYSLKWEDDLNGDWNLSTDDWDALFIPVRKAFDAASFKSWLNSGYWETVCDSSHTLVADRTPFDTIGGEWNQAQLPRMHQGEEDGKLDWGSSEFLDLIQH